MVHFTANDGPYNLVANCRERRPELLLTFKTSKGLGKTLACLLSSFWLHWHFWSLVRLLYTTSIKARNSHNYILSLGGSPKVVTFSICSAEPKGTEEEKANSKLGKGRKKKPLEFNSINMSWETIVGLFFVSSVKATESVTKQVRVFPRILFSCGFSSFFYGTSLSLRVLTFGCVCLSLIVSSFCFPLDPNLCSIDLFFRHSFILLKVVVFSCAVKWMQLMKLQM